MSMSTPQMTVIHEDAEKAFVERVCAHVRDKVPTIAMYLSVADLSRRVRYALARGRSHGLTWQSSLTAFVDLMCAVGPRFDRHPAFAAALAAPDDDENGRIYAIYDGVTATDWIAAQAAGTDDRAWYDACRENA